MVNGKAPGAAALKNRLDSLHPGCYHGCMFFGFVHAPNKGVIDRIIEKLRSGHNRQKVRCPACGWEPADHDTWCCSPGCGHVWNTFKTYGLCPGCTKQWTHTACLRCSAWTPHEDWYVDGDGEEGKW